jgi:hypothetical protein
MSPLNDPAFASLWKCASLAEGREMLAADPALAQRYSELSARVERRLEVSTVRLIFHSADPTGLPLVESCPVVRITTEGRSVVVQLATRGQLIGYVFRRQQSWILVSERYYGRASTLYPRSPVFRYHQEL